jgi:chloramphenicol O-acetyltransferase type A
MKYIDINNWNRKAHYSYFKELDYPHFSICGNVDITKFRKFIKDSGSSFFLSFLYASVKAANGIEELRCRIRQDKVVVHDKVDPSFTIMTSKEVFGFCSASYLEDYKEFYNSASVAMEKAGENASIEDEHGRDDLLYITSIPWVSFTGITHPIHMKTVDSIPRISWGKYFEENGKVKLPLSVQAHHALVDGAHIGRYYMSIQDILDNPKMHF